MKIKVGVSGRHCHLSEKHLEVLFGKDYQLTKLKDLSQPGQFAANEKIDIFTASGKSILGVRILGPVRKETQIEISNSDAIRAGIPVFVRQSGDTKGTPGAILRGPRGEIVLDEGVIVAARHIHFSLEDAKKFDVKDNEIVSVKVEGTRGGVFDNVICRVKEDFALDFHIDTDEASAFLLNTGDLVTLIK